jgi:hypothetical protein
MDRSRGISVTVRIECLPPQRCGIFRDRLYVKNVEKKIEFFSLTEKAVVIKIPEVISIF